MRRPISTFTALLRTALILGLLCQQTCATPSTPSSGVTPGTVEKTSDVEQNAIFGLENESMQSDVPQTLSTLLDALDVMQEEYYELWAGTWPSSIDWTAAVLGTHVSATLTTLISTIDYTSSYCADILGWENTINKYFTHLTAFYFGENAFSLRNEAYDDMLWVVLGWLENVKFSTHYTRTYWQAAKGPLSAEWHGTQLKGPAAHRARTFYDLASHGWTTELCNGGMNWNPALEPYKNAITNELFISASIAMYLYFPGDDNDSPFLATHEGPESPELSACDMAHSAAPRYPAHDRKYLFSALKAYRWLKSSNMTNVYGLFQDGFHIKGWRHYPNGTIDKGTRNCDSINTMVFTYNQGVLLSGLRGLWVATNNPSYLEDGHDLIKALINATGWPNTGSRQWLGLGRGGILEEYCDSKGDCSQDGHTFKGIYFHHLAEFCRPLWSYEEDFMKQRGRGLNDATYQNHQDQCLTYMDWIAHNAKAAVETKNDKGLYGTWWGRQSGVSSTSATHKFPIPDLPEDAIDYRNHDIPNEEPWQATTNPDTSATSEGQPPKNKTAKGRRGGDTEDVNDRGRGRTVETQSGGVAVLRALWQWQALLEKSSS